jgi:hypothetical protein
VNATPAELKKYSDAWDDTYNLIRETAEEQLGKTAEKSAKQIQELISQPGKAKADLSDAYAVLSMAAPQGYASKLSENTAEISKVTAEMVSRGIIEKMQDMQTDAYNTGWNTVIATKQGMIDAAQEPFEIPDFRTNALSSGSIFSKESQKNSSIFNAVKTASAENAKAVPKSSKTEVKIILPDGRAVAEWLIDDIDELSAVKLSMGV